jgi:hypothetical protein
VLSVQIEYRPLVLQWPRFDSIRLTRGWLCNCVGRSSFLYGHQFSNEYPKAPQKHDKFRGKYVGEIFGIAIWGIFVHFKAPFARELPPFRLRFGFVSDSSH